ncbi:hypothetical protein [Pseudomonas donghuensis]|uniref:hypothetical protein n=1 Tax=Pseudomonas donghuensis TaxID=1163398 RepID=UPI0020C34A86|nr:hypothetical protein [Pseudomonas donghuensis]MCP6695913.1 hypothetical protein [Pseudomonas donghuensis]
MPTENRSSNTEQMVSVPVSKLKKIHRDLDACQKVIWLRGGFDPAYCKDAQDSLKDIDALLAQPAAQHQGEPILIQAVAVTHKDDDEGLRLEWLLEGGISELEFSGQVLFAMPEANDLCDEDGSAEVFLHPPTSDGFSAGDMADQDAKAFAARDPEVEQLRAQLDELRSSVHEFVRIHGLSVDGSAARNKALIELQAAVEG